MSTYPEAYDALKADLARNLPSFGIRYKDESRLQRLLGKLMFFAPLYMTRFSTTFYPFVYVPSRAYEAERREGPAGLHLLGHEFVHLWDNRRSRLWFPLSYVLPQALALGALGAALDPRWLLCLLFLLPLPAPGRAHWERRGYAMNVAIHRWTGTGEESAPAFRAWIQKQFSGWAYWRMWPFGVGQEIDDAIRSVDDGSICEGARGEPYRLVRDCLARQGLVPAKGG